MVEHQLPKYMYWQKRIEENNLRGFTPVQVNNSMHITQFGEQIPPGDFGVIEYPTGVKVRIKSQELLQMVP